MSSSSPSVPQGPAPYSEEGAKRFGRPTRWRGITQVHPQELCASLSLLDDTGTVHRFLIPLDSLAMMAKAIADVIGTHARRTGSHSSSASGKPASDVSNPLEGVNV